MEYTHECPYCGSRYVCSKGEEFSCVSGLYSACRTCLDTLPLLSDVPKAMCHETQSQKVKGAR